jgi:glutaconate CoA-transferase, subunit B
MAFDITPDEIMVTCISRLVTDGEVIVQGIATPLIAAAFLLARKTHAPNLYFASAIGQGISKTPAPLGLTRIENYWLANNMKSTSFTQVTCEILPWLRPKEFFRPAQVDAQGNFNNIAFGQNYSHPRMRLPGTGGIPDMSTFSSQNYLYVPRHSRITFVPKLDFCSGLGYDDLRLKGSGPKLLISDLGVFDFNNGFLRLVSIHPGVSLEIITHRTGFQLLVSESLHETPTPSDLELHVLRNEIDPLGIRRLEFLPGAARRELLREMIQNENNQI